MSFLKEAIEEKDIRLESMDMELREKTRELEQTLIDNRTFQRKIETDMAETRVSLRIKTE